MSRVHKVIVLNKPFKLWDYTIHQLLLMGIGIIIAGTIFSRVPQSWKIGNLPANIMLAVLFICFWLPVVKFTDLKPIGWWKNIVLYKLKLSPTEFIPRPEEAAIYPDPTIIEPKKRSEEYYIGSGS